MPKYEVPTLLEYAGMLTDVDDETVYILQVYVPSGYEPETVAKLINDQTCIVCYCRNFIGLGSTAADRAAKYVYINVASAVAHRLPEIRKQICEVLQAEYGKAGSDVKAFLRAIDACASGSKFALQYDSMWDVWNAMIDQEQWLYFCYTVNQILDDDLKDKLKPFKLVNIERIRNMKDFYSRSFASDPKAPTAVFSTEYLKSINPFMRPEGKDEN
jgi:hypothetical protein